MFDHEYQRTRGSTTYLPPIPLSRISIKERKSKALMMLIPVLCFAGAFLFSGLFLLIHARSFARDLCPGSGTPTLHNEGQETARGKHYSTVGQGISIDLSFGDLDFTVAKSLDITWDIIVGRGGQLLLLWIAHKVYVATLNHLTESSSVGYEFYIALAFDAKPWAMIVAITKHMFSTRRYIPKILFVFYSVAYIAMFPTFMSAMTGYTNYTSPYIVFPDESMVPLEDFESGIEVFDSYLLLNGTRYPTDFEMTSCLDHPSGRYSYGFSKLVWKVVCGLHLFWVFGMYALWVDALFKSQLYQAGYRIGKYRAILDLAEALKEDLGPDNCAYNGEKMKKELSKTNPRLSYYQTRKGAPIQIGISSQTAGQSIDLDAAQGCLFGRHPGSCELGHLSDYGSPGLTRDAQFGRLGAFEPRPGESSPEFRGQ